MPNDVPWIADLTNFIFGDSDRAVFSEGTELGTRSRSTLQPKNQWDAGIWLNRVVSVSSEHVVKHA